MIKACLNLETAVGSTYLTQPIDSSGITGQSLITNKVTSICSVTPAKPICYDMHALPNAVSRLIGTTISGDFLDFSLIIGIIHALILLQPPIIG